MEDYTQKTVVVSIKEDDNVSTNKNNTEEINYKKLGFIALAGLLGSGRIISNIALVNQGMQKTFFYFGFPKAPTIAAVIAALGNFTSDSLTRFPAIYRGLTKKKEEEEILSYSSIQTAVYYSIVGAGVLDMIYFVLNNFSALIQLECQYINNTYINNTYCENGFDWPHIIPFVPGATICAISTGIAFAAFTLDSIKRNAKGFIAYFNDFSGNYIKENKLILAFTAFMAFMYSLSLGATLFFSSSKMTFNLFGPTLSEYKIIQAQIYISMVTAIIGGIFSWISEGKKLLQGQKAGFRNWFCENNSIGRIFFAGFVLPFLIANVLSHALNNFPGNIELLDKFFPGYEKLKKSIATVNALNTAFLYFAFNTGNALSNAADVPNDIPPGTTKTLTPETPLIQAESSQAKSLVDQGIFNASDEIDKSKSFLIQTNNIPITAPNKWKDMRDQFENRETEQYGSPSLLNTIGDISNQNKNLEKSADDYDDDNVIGSKTRCSNCIIF